MRAPAWTRPEERGKPQVRWEVPPAPRLSRPSLPPPTQSRSPDRVLGPGLAAGPPRSAREASLCRDARGLARPAPRSRAAARTHRARSSAAAGRRFLARRAGSGGGGASGSGVSGGSGQRGSQRRPGAEPSPERSPGPSLRPRPAAARRGAGGPALPPALSGGTCSAAGSPATRASSAPLQGSAGGSEAAAPPARRGPVARRPELPEAQRAVVRAPPGEGQVRSPRKHPGDTPPHPRTNSTRTLCAATLRVTGAGARMGEGCRDKAGEQGSEVAGRVRHAL